VKVKERKNNNEANWRKKRKRKRKDSTYLPMETSQQSNYQPAPLPKKKSHREVLLPATSMKKLNGLSPRRKPFSETMFL
jgi:hypothetical protein